MERYLGESTPKLGFGLMRLPRNKDGSYDVEQCRKMVDRFLASGFTYFDTAYVYDNGDSERLVKTVLTDRYPRDSFTLATKMSAWLEGRTEEKTKRQFTESLERTGAGYFDFYLLHSLKTKNLAYYDEYGLWDFLREQKEKGLIRHWGFSFHDGPELLDRLLTEHPEAEFVQLQINYADWEDPKVASRANWEVARRHGKPVVIMEPVKGGALANPPRDVRRVLEMVDPNASCASWAIRFAASLEGVITVLSGMSTLEQMEDNLSYMKDFQPMDEVGQAAIRAAQEALKEVDCIHCTGCRYCTSGCPQAIPIPDIFAARNRQLIWNQEERGRQSYENLRKKGNTASACLGCGQCEAACPQHLEIIGHLKECAEHFGDLATDLS